MRHLCLQRAPLSKRRGTFWRTWYIFLNFLLNQPNYEACSRKAGKEFNLVDAKLICRLQHTHFPPTPYPSVSECLRSPPKQLGSLRPGPDSSPNTVESLRAPRPALAEPCRAPPSWASSTFLASAGRCPPLATPETSPSSRDWGFYRALSPQLQITDS